MPFFFLVVLMLALLVLRGFRACSMCSMFPNTSRDFDWIGTALVGASTFSWLPCATFVPGGEETGTGFSSSFDLAACGGVASLGWFLRLRTLSGLLYVQSVTKHEQGFWLDWHSLGWGFSLLGCDRNRWGHWNQNGF